jgi:UDP-4-amino-4,6-dideoxy-N-acetyl-beta-L-altrosamine transaminase
MIPYGRQSISQDDIDSVVEILRSDHLTQGPMPAKFEDGVKKYSSAKHAVATTNATSALHLACLALGLGEHDWVWTSPISFVASANCAKYCQAQVDFVDVESTTSNMSIESLEKKLISAALIGKLPKIVIPVHMGGYSCDMKKINELSKKYGFSIIEDASHAVGGIYEGHKIGSCTYSDITVFSFHPVKIITTGEGGMATTNSIALAERMRLLRSHGITRDHNQFIFPANEEWYYEQQELGFNYRMTDIQAALGVSQLNQLDEFISKRNSIAERYDHTLSDCPLETLKIDENCLSSRHLYVIKMEDKNNPEHNRNVLFQYLRKNGVGVNFHYIPIHLQPYYRNLGPIVGYDNESFPEALKYFQSAMSLPIFPDLTISEQSFVIEKIKEFFNK